MTSRTYRLPAADRTGWLLGLGGAQVVPLGAGLAVAVVLLSRGGTAAVGVVPFALGAAIAFTRIGGIPLLEIAPAALSFVVRRHERRFRSPLPFPGPELVLPKAFGKCVFVERETRGEVVVVTVARRSGLAAATMRVTAPTAFLLCDDAEQLRFLDNFGAALAPLSREGGPVASLRWVSFAAPAGRAADGPVNGPAAAAYREVLDLLAGEAQHEVFLTLTVAAGGWARGRDRLVDTLLDEAGLLADRLSEAGLEAALINVADMAAVLRKRLDPAGRGSPPHLATLAEPTGLAATAAAGPLCVQESWSGLRIDATTHRCYHVVEWPRSEVPPAWTADLLLALPVIRAVCVVLEPVAPRVSRRAVERQAAKLDSDEEQRRRSGFRIGAEQDATRNELLARERELVAGHPDFDCSGFVVLSAADPAELDELEAQAGSVAAAAGVELAPCYGRHAESFSAVLPVPFASTRRSR